uniref:Uncharacterized protein n=1 Tax=Triticum urartu TaxID=4572 RepID=A0A8R7P6C1_TRIUA
MSHGMLVVEATIFPWNSSGPSRILISTVPSTDLVMNVLFKSNMLCMLTSVSVSTTYLGLNSSLRIASTSINPLLSLSSSTVLPCTSFTFRLISKNISSHTMNPLFGPVKINESSFEVMSWQSSWSRRNI